MTSRLSLTTPRPWKVLSALFVCAFVAMLVFTRFGVFLVFDVAGGLRGADNFKTTYDEAPIKVSHVLEKTGETVLPENIDQVSGIVAEADRFVLSTDQAEVFYLPRSDNPEAKAQRVSLFPFTPLLFKQGSLEAITPSENAYLLAGERGAYVAVENGSTVAERPMSELSAPLEVSGLAASDTHIFITSGEGMNIISEPISGAPAVGLTLDFAAFEKPGRSLAAEPLIWGGISFYEGDLYLVAENFPLIVRANPETGVVNAVFGVEGHQEFSDISAADGQLHLPSDHNYFDARPPLQHFALPTGAL